ncbi:hypothetical protein [Paraburkholderia sacchari]|uniref:hypothetical protein n=1 Tax=Paraburkholderia sacchari TaxID=159450 RepID=UPI000542CC00|nr:hypothetical protein [Paraburkholderia sacchari]NLP65380.1 hypothetical protein [Paraburkholderia sacchari]
MIPSLRTGIAALMLAPLGACTVVYIEGDSNSISDTGGHGGGVSLPQQQQAGLLDRLKHPQQ